MEHEGSLKVVVNQTWGPKLLQAPGRPQYLVQRLWKLMAVAFVSRLTLLCTLEIKLDTAAHWMSRPTM